MLFSVTNPMDRDGIVVGASVATAADAAAAGKESEGGGGGEKTVANAIHGTTTTTAMTDMPIIIPNDEIKPTDILLGRGSQHAQWEGNVRFRKIVKERRREYNSRRCKNKIKNAIAQEILDAVLNGRGSSLAITDSNGTTKLETAPPGRFLEQADADVAKKAGFSTDQCNWQVAGTKRTLDKIKMTLRQKKKGGEPRGADHRKRSSSSSSSSSSAASSPSPSSSRSGDDNDRKRLKSSHNPSGYSMLPAQPSSAATIPGTAIAPPAGIPRQVAFVGGAPTGGVGNTTGANNQQLLSVLASSLLGGGGAPGSVASNNNMLRQLQQPQLPALNAVNTADADVLLRALLAQQQQQQLQAAALAQLLQMGGGGGGGAPPSTYQGTGALPSPTRAAPPAIDPGIVLTLLGQLRQGQQQQQMPRQVPGPLPSAQVVQAILSQQRQVASVLSPPQPPSVPAPAPPANAAAAPGTSNIQNIPQGVQGAPNADAIALLLQTLAERNIQPKQN